MQAANDSLQLQIEELESEASEDPDAGRAALGAASVRRINKVLNRAPEIAMPDSALLQECQLPVDLGDNEIAQAQVEKLWIRDRYRLLSCYRRHLALRDFVLDRDSALRGGA